MIIEYTLNEGDFITNQLYLASKSERIKKKRQRARVLIPLIYAVFAVLFFFKSAPLTIGAFIAVAVLWYCLYPLWERGYYYRHYRGFIRENYKERINKSVILEINDDFIFGKDAGSESKLSTKEITEIDEIPTLILIRLNTGQSLILSKEKIKNLDVFIKRLNDLAEYLKIKYQIENDWKWK